MMHRGPHPQLHPRTDTLTTPTSTPTSPTLPPFYASKHTFCCFSGVYACTLMTVVVGRKGCRVPKLKGHSATGLGVGKVQGQRHTCLWARDGVEQVEVFMCVCV